MSAQQSLRTKRLRSLPSARPSNWLLGPGQVIPRCLTYGNHCGMAQLPLYRNGKIANADVFCDSYFVEAVAPQLVFHYGGCGKCPQTLLRKDSQQRQIRELPDNRRP